MLRHHNAEHCFVSALRLTKPINAARQASESMAACNHPAFAQPARRLVCFAQNVQHSSERGGRENLPKDSTAPKIKESVIGAYRQAHQRSESEASTSGRENGNGTSHSTVRISLSAPQRSAKAQEGGPAVVDYDQHFSKEAHQRVMPGLRILATAFTGLPDIIPLQGGLPPASAFPMKGIQLTLRNGSVVDISDPEELVAAQQYNLTMKGYPSVLDWVTEHTRQLHSPSQYHQTIVTGGSNYTLEMLFRLFMEPGDGILCEEYTYPHVPESLVLPAGYHSLRVEIDKHGIIPERLLATLEGLERAGKQMPKLLYTIPTGQNPTGATQTDERKRRIYAICRRFDLIIVEDDPYYFLQYTVGEPPRGFNNLGISYLSIDSDARVCRLDSFSKALAPGLRIGWLTAHESVIDKVLIHFHGVAMGACSLSQVVVGAILQEMGHSGFEAHIRDIQVQYARRAGIMMAAAEKHLTGLAEWAPISAGMFMWLRLYGFDDASQILAALQEAKVVVVPGKLTRHSGPSSRTPCPFVRLSFVTAPEEQLETAIQRLAELLRKYQGGAKPPCAEVTDISKPLDQGEVL